MEYEYVWVESTNYSDLSEWGADGWRVVPGIYDKRDQTEFVLMERRA